MSDCDSSVMLCRHIIIDNGGAGGGGSGGGGGGGSGSGGKGSSSGPRLNRVSQEGRCPRDRVMLVWVLCSIAPAKRARRLRSKRHAHMTHAHQKTVFHGRADVRW